MITKDLSGICKGQNNSVIIFRYYFPFIRVSASTMMVPRALTVKTIGAFAQTQGSGTKLPWRVLCS